jgi:hypothetical protein
MITPYRTQSTMQYSLIRRSFVLLSRHVAKVGNNLGMIPRVDRLGNAQLLSQNWANGIADILGIVLFDANGSDPISEQIRCWSHGKRLRLGRLRT